MVVSAPVLDWSGFYVRSSLWMPGLSPGVQAGFNIVRRNLVVGFEANAAVSGGTLVGGAAHVGLALGAEDRILPYVRLKAMNPIGFPVLLVAGDIGVEIGIGRRMSIYAEGGVRGAFGTIGGCCGLGLRTGVSVHFQPLRHQGRAATDTARPPPLGERQGSALRTVRLAVLRRNP